MQHSNILSPSDQLSISVWLKIDEFSNTWSPVLQKGLSFQTGGKNREYALWANSAGYLALLSAGNGKKQAAHKLNISTGEWFHYGASLNRKDKKASLYLNGQLVHTQSDPYTNFNNGKGSLTIGSCPSIEQFKAVSNFRGTIDDLKLYDVALSAFEFEQIIDDQAFVRAQESLSKKEDHLLGYWKFNRDGKDSSPHANDAILLGGNFIDDRNK